MLRGLLQLLFFIQFWLFGFWGWLVFRTEARREIYGFGVELCVDNMESRRACSLSGRAGDWTSK
jgi:hypothetical protein